MRRNSAIQCERYDSAAEHRLILRRCRIVRFEQLSASGVYTELQCGSYIFMDADYRRNLDRDGAPTKAFEPSPFVWAAVMSRPAEGDQKNGDAARYV